MTLIDIWSGLHGDALQWNRAAFAADTLSQRAAIDDNSRALLETLSSCPSDRWLAFIQAQGITQTGAIALSWCDTALLPDVAGFFLAHIKTSTQIDRRAARLLNPAMVPTDRSLQAMVQSVESDVKSLVLTCLGDLRPVVFDISQDWLRSLPPILGAVLLERYDPSVSKLAPAILDQWKAAA